MLQIADAIMAAPIVVAHRGLHSVHPENSFAAFAAAWEAGIFWCECDVHATADGVPVVIHDETLDRTTSKSGRVSETSYSALKGIVPTLSEVIAAMPPDCGMIIEIKPSDNAKLVRRVVEETEGCLRVIQSFDQSNVTWPTDANSPPAAILIESAETLAQAINSDFTMVNVDQKLLDLPAIDELIQNGQKLGVWTVNTHDEIQRARRRRAWMLFTDEPLLAMRLCSGRSD